MVTKQINFYSYQLDFQKLVEGDRKKNTSDKMVEYFNGDIFLKAILNLWNLEVSKRKKIYNSNWYMILDKLYFYDDNMNELEKEEEILTKKTVKFVIGKIAHGEFGYVSELTNVDSLNRREHDKQNREAEDKYLYFSVRLQDGLLLLQGDTKLNNNKWIDYIYSKAGFNTKEVRSMFANNLLKEDFEKEIEALEIHKSVEIEVSVEDSNDSENEIIKTINKQAGEINSNYYTIGWKAKYKNNSLGNVGNLIKQYVSKSNKIEAIKGVKKIKVIGQKSDGTFQTINLKNITRKNILSIEANSNSVLNCEETIASLFDCIKTKTRIR